VKLSKPTEAESVDLEKANRQIPRSTANLIRILSGAPRGNGNQGAKGSRRTGTSR
jgi:hypothetical protein